MSLYEMSYGKLRRFAFERRAEHTCRCKCGCDRLIDGGHNKCTYCRDGSCPASVCDKCGGTGYIWDNEKQENRPCKCKG